MNLFNAYSSALSHPAARADKKLADYILSQPDETRHPSSQQLAVVCRCRVSPAWKANCPGSWDSKAFRR